MRAAFVTGADRGLGRAFVDVLAARGFHVFAGCLDLAQSAAPRASAAARANVTELPLDVRDLGSVERARELVSAESDRLDVLINNAGVNTAKFASLEELDFEVVSAVLDVNAVGPLRVTQRFAPLLERGDEKLIVNISSEAGSLARCERSSWYAYCMSKAALNMQTRILNNYLRPRGFRVFAVHPGWIRTTMTGPDAPLQPEDSARQICALFLDGRGGTEQLPEYVQYDGSPYPW